MGEAPILSIPGGVASRGQPFLTCCYARNILSMILVRTRGQCKNVRSSQHRESRLSVASTPRDLSTMFPCSHDVTPGA